MAGRSPQAPRTYDDVSRYIYPQEGRSTSEYPQSGLPGHIYDSDYEGYITAMHEPRPHAVLMRSMPVSDVIFPTVVTVVDIEDEV